MCASDWQIFCLSLFKISRNGTLTVVWFESKYFESRSYKWRSYKAELWRWSQFQSRSVSEIGNDSILSDSIDVSKNPHSSYWAFSEDVFFNISLPSVFFYLCLCREAKRIQWHFMECMSSYVRTLWLPDVLTSSCSQARPIHICTVGLLSLQMRIWSLLYVHLSSRGQKKTSPIMRYRYPFTMNSHIFSAWFYFHFCSEARPIQSCTVGFLSQ